jgi:hypothetical protein
MGAYEGKCFCGAVEYETNGAPEAAGYCHCADCRSWSASPINAFTLWKPTSLKINKGQHAIGEYQKTDRSLRQFCKQCGGHLFTVHPKWNLVDVFAASIPSFPFRPEVHVNYAESVLHIHDGLPKLRDLPKEMGGSGEAMAE